MLCEVVGSICDAAAPVNDELALRNAVTNPVEAHIHRFGSLLLDGVVGNAGGSAIVGDDGGGRLGMAKFFERDALGYGFLAVVE